MSNNMMVMSSPVRRVVLLAPESAQQYASQYL
jgi:hypothetical protein